MTVVQYSTVWGLVMVHLPENKITCGAVKYTKYICVCVTFAYVVEYNVLLFQLAFVSEKRGGSEPDKDI